MRFVKNRKRNLAAPLHDDDPLSGVANLFDLSLVFIVAVLMALFSTFSSKDLFSPSSEWTMTRKNEQGQMEIITKKNNEIKVQKVTSKSLSGNGQRLGMAYKLDDGRVVYVEEPGPAQTEPKP